MIGIDIKMPKACMCCDLEYWASGYGNRCSATFAETTYIRAKSRHPDCPLHPLDNEIRIGDEVKVKQITGVVVKIDEHGVRCIDEMGNGLRFEVNDMTRTGRHFDEVETMLKKMRGEDDG